MKSNRVKINCIGHTLKCCLVCVCDMNVSFITMFFLENNPTAMTCINSLTLLLTHSENTPVNSPFLSLTEYVWALFGAKGYLHGALGQVGQDARMPFISGHLSG